MRRLLRIPTNQKIIPQSVVELLRPEEISESKFYSIIHAYTKCEDGEWLEVWVVLKNYRGLPDSISKMISYTQLDKYIKQAQQTCQSLTDVNTLGEVLSEK